MLNRIYESDGGPETLDVLMKYLYVMSALGSIDSSLQPLPNTAPSILLMRASSLIFPSSLVMLSRYKGMSHNSPPTPNSTRSLAPQPTGFSQIHSRGGGEGGGQAMSVLLSWHEKLVEIAGKGSIVRVMTDRRTV